MAESLYWVSTTKQAEQGKFDILLKEALGWNGDNTVSLNVAASDSGT